jgi:hypothetical protein
MPFTSSGSGKQLEQIVPPMSKYIAARMSPKFTVLVIPTLEFKAITQKRNQAKQTRLSVTQCAREFILFYINAYGIRPVVDIVNTGKPLPLKFAPWLTLELQAKIQSVRRS